MSEPKRHHYLPVCYLSGFADSAGFLHGFDRSGASYIQTPPKAIACEKYLYSMVAPDGSRDNRVEKEFSQLEGTFPAVRNLLEAGRQISPAQRNNLDAFVVAQFGRVPSMLKWFSEFGERAKERRFRHNSSIQHLREVLMKTLSPDQGIERWPEERLTKMLSDLNASIPIENLTMSIMMEVMHQAHAALAGKSLAVGSVP